MENLKDQCANCPVFEKVNRFEKAALHEGSSLALATTLGFTADPIELQIHFRNTARMIAVCCKSGLICPIFNPPSTILK